MHHKILTLTFLAATLTLVGCQSGVTNIPVSRNSEMGQAIAKMDDAEQLYNKRVDAYRKAMMAYEATHGGDRRTIFYSYLSQPTEVLGPNVTVCNLQGAFNVDEHIDYKAKITYEDEAHLIVKDVEILEKVTR
jgi:hypothetical protein